MPTVYKAPRSVPVQTNQYSVTHYVRTLEHDRGTPGIFFKFDIEPLQMTVHQRTTTLVQFLIRYICHSSNYKYSTKWSSFRSVVGVVGGVWCCAGWAFRISAKAIDVVSGADRAPGIVAAEATGTSLKKKWGGGELRARVARQGSGWVVDGGSPYGSYTSTPVSAGGFGMHTPMPAVSPYSPAPHSGVTGNGDHANESAHSQYGLGLNSPSLFATQQQRTPALGANSNGGLLSPASGVGVMNLNSPSPYGVSSNPISPMYPQTPGFGPQSPPVPVGPPPKRTPPRDMDSKKAD